jgi:mannosylglucosylglycerate synthase
VRGPAGTAPATATVAFVSFRFGDTDGVSVEARKWAGILGRLGFETYTVAAEGADRYLPGLAMNATEPPAALDLADALAGADLVVVENLCSLPLNPAAADAVATAIRGRPAILHHHDLAWQRPHLAHFAGYPPDDPAWRHVTINDLSRRQLAERGIEATTIPNGFDPDPPAGDRDATRAALGLAPHERLLVHPTRAVPRKNVAGALALAEGLHAAYWLLGPPEDGYGDELDRLLAATTAPVIGRPPAAGITLADAYAAADAVALPSTWEGFGNATIESALVRRPLAIGTYPVAREIAAYGFRWFPAGDPRPLSEWFDHPDPSLLDANAAIARRHFSLDAVGRRLARLLAAAGWMPT